jgi:tetratricopeptide (TPR) repeat protein
MRTGLLTGARWSRLLVAGVLALSVGASPQLRAADKAAAPQLSPEISKLLHDAQEAQKKQDWDKMLELSRKAYSQSTKPYDQETSARFIAAVGAGKKDFDVYAEGTSKLVDLPIPADEKQKFLEQLTRISAGNKDYDKAIAYAQRWYDGGGGAAAGEILTQLYLQKKDCANAVATIQKMTESTPATEQQLKWQYGCAQQTGDKDKMRALTAQIVAHYPNNRDYVMNEVAFAAQAPSDDRALLNALRFAYEKDYLESALHYNTYASLAKDAGAVEEAEAVLQRGVSRGAVAGDTNVNKQLAEVKRLSAEDKKGLPALDKEARAGANGQADFAVGEAYYGLGQYDKAVEAIQRGLQPDRVGKIKRVDDAYMLLGISYLKLGKVDEAKKAFDSVKGNQVMTTIASAWVSSATSGTAASPAPAAPAAPPATGATKP